MNLKNTWLLLAIAALLAGFIFAWDKYVAAPGRVPVLVMPGLVPEAVTSVQVRVAGQPDVFAERTNGGWQLTKPLAYPAQARSVESLLATLATIKPDRFISPRELVNTPDAETAFGFDSPFATLTLFSGRSRWQLIIGAHTAPGNQVFVELVGTPGMHLVSTNLLDVIPQTPAAWRDPELLEWRQLKFDRVQVNNGARTIELQRNATNHLWRLARLQTRADSAKVNDLLQQLQSVQVGQFVTDNPQADLDAYGLQTPALEMIFSQGTNTTASLQFGRSPTNDAKVVYARRGGSATVFTVPLAGLEPWQAPAVEFRDHHLVTFTALPDSIEVAGRDHFTLVRGTNQMWRVLPQDFPADTNTMNHFLLTLAKMEVVQFVKDVVTEPELQPKYGLGSPLLEYTIKTGGTNASTVRLMFGTNSEDIIYARRGDEDSVYGVKLQEVNLLPVASWEMFNRRIWHFTEEDVASVLIEQNGRKRELIRNGTNAWSFAAGSAGNINVGGVEEAVHRAGDLEAAFWTARGSFDRAQYGFTNPLHRLTFQLKDGATRVVDFGGEAPSQFPYATVTLKGEPWLFEFPWTTYQLIQTYLGIPVREF